MNLKELESVVEALLFLSGDAVPLQTIADTVELDKATTKAILKSLREKYNSEMRGIRLTEFENSWQMCTAPDCFSYLRERYKAKSAPNLSQTLLETLAIIAYRQPITKAQIEEIRGVSAEPAVNKLIERGLVCEKGRMDGPGKPVLFGTTQEFLRYFGFQSVKDLPPLEKEQQSVRSGKEDLV